MRRLIGFRTVGATTPGPGPGPEPEPNEHFTVDVNGIIRAPDLSIFRPDGSNVVGANSYVWGDSFDAHGKAATFQARGYRAVRLVYCERCESHGPGSRNYGALADLIDEYTSLGMVVIIDNHEYDLGGDPPTSGDIAETVALMGGFAQQFGDNPYVWYECFNEPFDEGFGNALDLQTWLDIHRPVCTAIRQHTEAPILCCASMFGQDRGGYGGVRVEDSSLLNGIPVLMDEFGTVIGDLHGYHRWGGATTAEDHRGYWQEARSRGVAIVVGEFGAWGLHGDFDSQEREASELWWSEAPRYAGLIPWMTGSWGDEFWTKHAARMALPVEDDYDDGSPGGGDGDEAFLVGTGSFTSTSTVNATTVPLPAHQEGDALVVMVAINQATGTIDTPSGWTAFANATTGANLTSRAFWRRAPSGGAGASVTVSHSGSRRTSGVSAAVRNGGDPYLTIRTSSGSGSVATNQSLSITGEAALALAMVGYRTGGLTWGDASGWVEQDFADGGSTNTGARVSLRSEQVSGALEPQGIWTLGSFTNWDLYAIAFDSVPASGSGPAPVPVATAAIYGVGFVAESLANMPVGRYGTAKAGYRFRADHTGEIESFRLYYIFEEPGYGAGTGGTVRMSLCKQQGSSLVDPGEVLAYVDAVNPNQPEDEFAVWTFPEPVPVVSGQVYFLTFENTDPDSENNWVSVDAMYHDDPDVPKHPAIVDDADLGCISNYEDDVNWNEEPQYTPILDLYYVGGHVQGQGYMEFEQHEAVTVDGSTAVALEFTVSDGDKTVDGMYCNASEHTGGPFTLTLETAAGTPLASDSNVTFPGAYKWGGAVIDPAVTLEESETYRLKLTAPSGSTVRMVPIRQGDDYGFQAPTMFSDGVAKVNTGSGWEVPVSDDRDWSMYLTTGLGFPDASNTGAVEPSGGWQSAPISGGTGLWQYFTDGGTIEDIYIEGQIRVRANNVTIRNCYVVATFENQAGIWGFEGDNLVVENCTVVGADMDIPAAAGVVGYQTCRRCNVSNTADGLKGGSDPGELTEYNYIHHLRLGFTGTPHEPGVNNTHADGIQWQGADGAIVRYNRIHGPYYDGGGPDQPAGVTDDSVNGGIFMKTDSGNCTGVTIEGNEVYGFGFNLYLYATSGRTVTGTAVRNRLGRGSANGYARFGPLSLTENTGDVDVSLDGNRDQDGDPVP